VGFPWGRQGPALEAGSRDVVIRLLRHPRYEVIPLKGIEEQIVRHVPPEVRLTVTASPSRGLDPTIELAERLAGLGFRVVPHVSARLVVDEAHLRDLLQRMSRAGLDDVFVIAGDRREVAGKFADSLALLTAMATIDHDVREIGIAGYPESHPFIDDDVTIQAMWDKRRFATYIVSNLCFDAHVITSWIARVRRRGVELPIYVGMPGKTDPAKLFRVATRIGVGESARFLRWHSNGFLRLLMPGRHNPTRLIAGMFPQVAEPASQVAGLHIYTFNDIERTERWRCATLAELDASA
jgi:methylenetetrahydrofolate reductase (NADPH)